MERKDWGGDESESSRQLSRPNVTSSVDSASFGYVEGENTFLASGNFPQKKENTPAKRIVLLYSFRSRSRGLIEIQWQLLSVLLSIYSWPIDVAPN